MTNDERARLRARWKAINGGRDYQMNIGPCRCFVWKIGRTYNPELRILIDSQTRVFMREDCATARSAQEWIEDEYMRLRAAFEAP